MNNGKYKEYVIWDGTITDYFENIIVEHVMSDHVVWAVNAKQAALKWAKDYKEVHPMVTFAKINPKYMVELV